MILNDGFFPLSLRNGISECCRGGWSGRKCHLQAPFLRREGKQGMGAVGAAVASSTRPGPFPLHPCGKSSGVGRLGMPGLCSRAGWRRIPLPCTRTSTSRARKCRERAAPGGSGAPGELGRDIQVGMWECGWIRVAPPCWHHLGTSRSGMELQNVGEREWDLHRESVAREGGNSAF